MYIFSENGTTRVRVKRIPSTELQNIDEHNLKVKFLIHLMDMSGGDSVPCDCCFEMSNRKHVFVKDLKLPFVDSKKMGTFIL